MSVVKGMFPEMISMALLYKPVCLSLVSVGQNPLMFEFKDLAYLNDSLLLHTEVLENYFSCYSVL